MNTNPTPTTPEALARSTAEKIHPGFFPVTKDQEKLNRAERWCDDERARIAAILLPILSALTTERDEAVKSKDGAYLERNRVVAALAKCFPSGVARTAIEGWEPEWHGCVYIDLPTGQISWHFHDSQALLFADLPSYAGKWDGHDTDEKYRRVAALTCENADLRAQLSALTSQHEMACRENGHFHGKIGLLAHKLTGISDNAPSDECLKAIEQTTEASKIVAQSYDNAHQRFSVNTLELLQRCQNGEATCMFTAQVIENEMAKAESRHARLLEMVDGTLVPAAKRIVDRLDDSEKSGQPTMIAVNFEKVDALRSALSAYAATAREQTEKRGGE